MAEGTVFVVVHAEVHYRSPARYGETLVIETVAPEMTAASITFAHVVKDKVSGRVVAEGAARLAATDGNGKVKRLDKVTVAAIQSDGHSAERRSRNVQCVEPAAVRCFQGTNDGSRIETSPAASNNQRGAWI